MEQRAEPYLHERLWCHPGEKIPASGATTVFEDGRPIRTEYAGGEPETYEYDAGGRLVVINESSHLWHSAVAGERVDTGGRLELTYDERGLKRIGDVWQRLDEPFEELLARGTSMYADEVVRTLEGHGERGARVFALCLVYVAQGSLHSQVQLGLDEDRPFDDPADLVYPETYVEEVEDDEELDALLMSQATWRDPGDPYRLVLGEVCRRLAQRDWSGLIVPTEDFVVFCAEHDEDVEPKVEMIRAVNPPERVALWEAVFRSLA
jgi:YD repeat-containing protein